MTSQKETGSVRYPKLNKVLGGKKIYAAIANRSRQSVSVVRARTVPGARSAYGRQRTRYNTRARGSGLNCYIVTQKLLFS